MVTAKDVIKRQLDESITVLFRAITTLTDDEFFEEPPIGASVAWTLNHLSAFQDWVIANFTHQPKRFTTEKREAFKGGRPVHKADSEHYEDRETIIANFATIQEHTIAALESFDIERWNEATPTGCRFATYGEVWEALASENYWHLGQLATCAPRLAGTMALVPVPRIYSLEFEKGGGK